MDMNSLSEATIDSVPRMNRRDDTHIEQEYDEEDGELEGRGRVVVGAEQVVLV